MKRGSFSFLEDCQVTFGSANVSAQNQVRIASKEPYRGGIIAISADPQDFATSK